MYLIKYLNKNKLFVIDKFATKDSALWFINKFAPDDVDFEIVLAAEYKKLKVVHELH